MVRQVADGWILVCRLWALKCAPSPHCSFALDPLIHMNGRNVYMWLAVLLKYVGNAPTNSVFTSLVRWSIIICEWLRDQMWDPLTHSLVSIDHQIGCFQIQILRLQQHCLILIYLSCQTKVSPKLSEWQVVDIVHVKRWEGLCQKLHKPWITSIDQVR